MRMIMIIILIFRCSTDYTWTIPMKFNMLATFLLILLGNQSIALADEDPAEIKIGERLFLETRFAHAYYANPNKADPVMDETMLTSKALRGPFAGKTMNCRACHMVDDHAKNPSAGMRSYADYAKRPPVPSRKDGAKTSGRNSMSMVNISLPHHNQESAVFHFDGQFNSMEDLVRATYTGRNFGWLVGEDKLAIKHIAKIIRQDNGSGELAKEFGGRYSTVLQGTNKNIPNKFKLPSKHRIDVKHASDLEIFNTVAKLVATYVSSLTFEIDGEGNYVGSPYDAFLKKNNLPRKPKDNESPQEYSLRLIEAVNRIKQPKFITSKTNKFKSHKQEFVFTKKELQGMKLFFKKGSQKLTGGNCVSCHTAPHFSDFGFHNTGLVQQNYDELHGSGEFMKLVVPGLAERNKKYNAFLPATSKHPLAGSRFRSIAAKNKIGYTDLGLWNVFANPDMPAPQEKLKNIMCMQSSIFVINKCNNAAILKNTVAAFKTPVLRDLGHSNPYMHTGQFSDLQQAVRFYITSSNLAQNKKLRNSEEKITNINISEKDIDPLVAFLKSLNEDYE